ncbi:hypothetical protein BGZ76_001663 [Entomortierella beljakovae]|nr:hypothetical protein BGZ76_001663 [Entomortierella beljakovae]
MNLEKVGPEESKRILRQWIKTTIEERQKFEVKRLHMPNPHAAHTSSCLKSHVVGLDKQYKECKDLLVDFKLDKTRSQNDLMEKKHESPNEENDHPASSTRGRGRGRGTGRGRGRGKTIKVDPDSGEYMESSNLALISRKKPRSALGAARSQDSEDSEVMPQLPLPHPQDGYGWDEDDVQDQQVKIEDKEGEEEEEERLIRKTRPNSSSSRKALLSNNTHDATVEQNKGDLSANAQDLINRVSKAANIGHPKDGKSSKDKDILQPTSKPEGLSSSKKTVVKREESDQLNHLVRKVEHDLDSDNDSIQDSRTPKRQKIDQSDYGREADNNSRKPKAILPPDVANLRQRSRHPVVSMRKTGAIKTVSEREKNSLESTPQPPALKSFSSTESTEPAAVKRTRSAMLLESPKRADGNTRKSKESVQASIISEEDLYKELEKN